MSKVRFARFFVLGAATVTLAGYTAYAKRESRAMAAEHAVSFAGRFDGLQVANRAAKTNRLLVQAALTSADPQATYTIASAEPDAALPQPTNPVTAATPVIPPVDIAPAPDTKAAAVVPTPHEKPAEKIEKAAEKIKKAVVAAVAPQHETAGFDENQIAGLRGRLRLSEDQIGYWPAVEEALRDVYRTQLRGQKPGHANIDTNSPEVQKLVWAAMPLLMRMREDQKNEVRKLARGIGLEQVASQI